MNCLRKRGKARSTMKSVWPSTLHSRKFTAALQASGSANPVMLRTSANSGHGIGSSLDERIAQQTDELTFLFDQLGMTWKPGN